MGFRVSGFRVSRFLGFRFQGFIQIGVGIAIGIGIDHLTAEHFLGFLGFRVSGFQVSGFQGFWFQGFWFLGFIQIGVGVGIGIAIAIGIVDPRPATFDPRRSTGTPAFPTPQVAFQGFKVSGFHGFRFQGFWASSGSGSLSGSGSGTSTRDPRHSTRDDRQGRLSPAYAPVSKTPSIALAAKYGDYVYSRGCSPPKKPLRLRASALKKRPTHTRSPSPKQSVRDRGMRV